MFEPSNVTADTANAFLASCGIDDEQPVPIVNGQKHNGHSTFDARAFLASKGVNVRSESNDARGVKLVLEHCPFDESHKAPDAAVFIGNDGKSGFKCLHNSCAGKDWRALREFLDPGCYDRKVAERQPGESTAILGTGQRKPVIYRRITSEELDAATFKLDYLIENVFVAGQPMLIAGAHKALKTSNMLDMAISMGLGGNFLGYFPVTRRVRVGVMSGESGMATIQETARRICDAAGCRLSDSGVIWSDSIPKFGPIDHMDAIAKFIREDALEVLCVDPAYLAMPAGDAGNLFAQGELLRSMAEVCQAESCAMTLAHHTKRGVANPHAPPELADIAWSGFAEFARQWMLLSRREPYTPGTGQHRLWLATGGSAGHGGLYGLDINEGTRQCAGGRFWSVRVASPDEVQADVKDQRKAAKEQQAETKEKQQQEKLEADRRAVVQVVHSMPGKVATKTDIGDRTGLNGTNVNRVVATLLNDGTLIPTEITKGNNRKYPALTPQPDNPTTATGQAV